MSESTLERLFWEELDGPPSSRRRRRIEALVAAEPHQRQLLEELQALAAAFEAAKEVPPPPQLRAAVRQTIAGRPQPRARRRGRLQELLQPLFATPGRTRFAWATLAVLAVGIGLLATAGWPPAGVESSRLSGALGVGDRAAVLALPGSTGELAIGRDGNRVTLTLNPAELRPLWIAVEGAGAALVESSGPAAAREAGGDAIELLVEGPVTLVLEVEDRARPLGLRLSTAAGETVLEHRIELR